MRVLQSAQKSSPRVHTNIKTIFKQEEKAVLEEAVVEAVEDPEEDSEVVVEAVEDQEVEEVEGEEPQEEEQEEEPKL